MWKIMYNNFKYGFPDEQIILARIIFLNQIDF